MTYPRSNTVLAYIHSQLESANTAQLSDRQLLECFAVRHDENAFKAILRRHGPKVMGVCLRVLGRKEDAEDIFQATFLALARRAGALDWRESVGSWLYKVAHHLAQTSQAGQKRTAEAEECSLGLAGGDRFRSTDRAADQSVPSTSVPDSLPVDGFHA